MSYADLPYPQWDDLEDATQARLIARMGDEYYYAKSEAESKRLSRLQWLGSVTAGNWHFHNGKMSRPYIVTKSGEVRLKRYIDHHPDFKTKANRI